MNYGGTKEHAGLHNMTHLLYLLNGDTLYLDETTTCTCRQGGRRRGHPLRRSVDEKRIRAEIHTQVLQLAISTTTGGLINTIQIYCAEMFRKSEVIGVSTKYWHNQMRLEIRPRVT